MSRLTQDGTAELVSRDQILRHVRGQENIHFLCSADHEQDWQPYPVDPYSATCDDHTYIPLVIRSADESTINTLVEHILLYMSILKITDFGRCSFRNPSTFTPSLLFNSDPSPEMITHMEGIIPGGNVNFTDTRYLIVLNISFFSHIPYIRRFRDDFSAGRPRVLLSLD